MSIELKINLPDRSFPLEKADKVVLPIAKGNLTVIDDRAPTMQLLEAGVVALLDENNTTHKKWFINGGIADIAQNKCNIAVEEAVDLSKITLEEAQTKAPENIFYQKLYNYLKAFG